MANKDKSLAPIDGPKISEAITPPGFSDVSQTALLFDESYVKHNDQFLSLATKDIRDFVVGRFVDLAQFNRALSSAEKAGLPVDYVLIMEGFIDCDSYLSALAETVDITFIDHSQSILLQPFADQILQHKNSSLNNILLSSSTTKILVPWGMGPEYIKQYRHNMAVKGITVSLTSPNAVRQTLLHSHGNKILLHAIHQLKTIAPNESAVGGLNKAQSIGLFLITMGVMFGFWLAPVETGLFLSAFFSLVFFFLISFRLSAILYLKNNDDRTGKGEVLSIPDSELPIYTILVPLFHETNVLHQLISGLLALDYPKGKLDIKLLFEEIDNETIGLVNSLNLPPYFDIIIVPEMKPQTKPKALNFGLEFARGDYVVIFDAEDIPEPDQLRLALSQFKKGSEKLATIQAKLNFYNPDQNWWTRQFTIEYSSLFDWILPFFTLVDLPLPLGGTSNHFKRNILEKVGGWDAYNVTEDADLGMRLYRRGYRSGVLASTTYEEACSGVKNWLYQRTRWMKGWMQTYYVHMRTPYTLLRELGPWQFIGFQAIIGGPILSFLVHPIFLVILLAGIPHDIFPESIAFAGLWSISLFNLFFGYLATMWLGFMALHRRGFARFSLSLIFIPIYWLAISIAAYRALFQLVYAPFRWEKTHHVGRLTDT